MVALFLNSETRTGSKKTVTSFASDRSLNYRGARFTDLGPIRAVLSRPSATRAKVGLKPGRQDCTGAPLTNQAGAAPAWTFFLPISGRPGIGVHSACQRARGRTQCPMPAKS